MRIEDGFQKSPSHLKTEPFTNQTALDHWKSEHFWYWSPQCNVLVQNSGQVERACDTDSIWVTVTCLLFKSQNCSICHFYLKQSLPIKMLVDLNIRQRQWGSEIWPFEIRKHLKSGLFKGRFSNGQALAIAIVPTIKFWTIQNPDIFVWISNGFWQNGSNLSGFQMVGLPDFRSHSKSRPFATQPLFDHSKSRLVQISDLHCKYLFFRCARHSNPTCSCPLPAALVCLNLKIWIKSFRSCQVF